MAKLTQVDFNSMFNAANPTPPLAVPASLAAGASYNTGIMQCAGYPGLAAAANLAAAGSISIQRYMDAAGNFPIGAAVSQTLTGGTLGTAAVRDGLPCAFWQVTVTNTSGGTANLTAFNLLQVM